MQSNKLHLFIGQGIPPTRFCIPYIATVGTIFKVFSNDVVVGEDSNPASINLHPTMSGYVLCMKLPVYTSDIDNVDYISLLISTTA